MFKQINLLDTKYNNGKYVSILCEENINEFGVESGDVLILERIDYLSLKVPLLFFKGDTCYPYMINDFDCVTRIVELRKN